MNKLKKRGKGFVFVDHQEHFFRKERQFERKFEIFIDRRRFGLVTMMVGVPEGFEAY